MTDTLTNARKAQGKATLPKHHVTEHRLSNWILTGQFDSIDHRTLDCSQLHRLKAIRMLNTRLLLELRTYLERKAALRLAFPLPSQGGNDVSA